MARTVVEWEEYDLIKDFPNAKRHETIPEVVQDMKEDYESAQRDWDVCTDAEGVDYYAGRMDALKDILLRCGWLVAK